MKKLKKLLIIIGIILGLYAIGSILDKFDIIPEEDSAVSTITTKTAETTAETTTEEEDGIPKYICIQGKALGRKRGLINTVKKYYLIDTVDKKLYGINKKLENDGYCYTGNIIVNDDDTITMSYVLSDGYTQKYLIYVNEYDRWEVSLEDGALSQGYDTISIEEFVTTWNNIVDYNDLDVKKLTVEQFS